MVLMRLNYRRYCRPLPPPQPPSLPPLVVQRLRHCFCPLFSRFTVAFYCTSISRFLLRPARYQQTMGSLSPLLWISFLPPTYNFESPTFTPLFFLLIYPSFLKLKLYNEHAYVSRTGYLSIFSFCYFLHFKTWFSIETFKYLKDLDLRTIFL